MPFEPRDELLHAAEPREVGAACPHCQRQVRPGEMVSTCGKCAAVHHVGCWQAHDGCGTYECAPLRRDLAAGQQANLRISAGELDAARPLPKPRPPVTGAFSASYAAAPLSPSPGTNTLAIAAFVVALAGIPLFGIAAFVVALAGISLFGIAAFVVALAGISLIGIVTGIVAVLLGALALGRIQQTRQRGTLWAAAGVILGLVDVVGWMLFLAMVFPSDGPGLAIDDFEMDPAVLENATPTISRALRANVFLEIAAPKTPFGSQAIGSGVIVGLDEGQAMILTNRHVIDPAFVDGDPDRVPSDADISVRVVGQLPVSAEVIWLAPRGIDLAIIAASVHSPEARSAIWQEGDLPAMGSDVFSIGNPQGLGWSHTRGTVSQVRIRRYGSRQISTIQTDTAVNSGNSGGGLYDQRGMLVGINTWTNDKRVSEGLSFAISVKSLLELDPPLPRPEENPQQATP